MHYNWDPSPPCQQYVPGIGLVTSATPELLERAVQAAILWRAEEQVRARLDARPRRPVILPVEPDHYMPPARPVPRVSYARKARIIGQVQAMIVVIIGGTSALFSPHDWAGAARGIGILLFLTQLLHWYVWSRRNDL